MTLGNGSHSWSHLGLPVYKRTRRVDSAGFLAPAWREPPIHVCYPRWPSTPMLHTRHQAPAPLSLAFNEGRGAARPHCCLSSQTGRLSLATRDLEQMSVSSRGAGKAATSTRELTDCRPLHCPSTRSPKETLVQRSPTLPSPGRAVKERGQGQWRGGRASGGGLRTRSRGSQPTLPDHRASAGNMVTTPDLFFPRYHAICGSAWSKPKSNGAKHGPTWRVFLNPFRGDTPQGKLSPRMLSAE